VEAPALSGPLGKEERRQGRQFRPGGEGALGVLARHQVGLDAEEVQAPALGTLPAPEVQQGQDVEPRPKAQLGDGEAPASRPGRRQVASLEEHGPRLRETIVGSEVGVAVEGRARASILGPFDRRIARAHAPT